MKTVIIKAQGIKCRSCVQKIKAHLATESSISSVDVSDDLGVITINCPPEHSNMGLKKSIEELGFSVTSIKKEIH